MSARWHQYFMDMAQRTAQMSYAKRLKVGAVAVRDKRIVCVGFNGTPPGEDNECEIVNSDLTLTTKANVIHAEKNLIRFADEHHIDLTDCTLYITHSCCEPCAQAIVDAGIKTVVFDQEYRCSLGLETLRKNDVVDLQLVNLL